MEHVSVKDLSTQEMEAVCLGLDSLTRQVAVVAFRLRNDPLSSHLAEEAMALGRHLALFRTHLHQHVRRKSDDHPRSSRERSFKIVSRQTGEAKRLEEADPI